MTENEINTLLSERDISPTRQRMAIGRVLLAGPTHMSADQVRAEVRDAGCEVSKATVYNTLNLFVEQGLVREVIVDPERVFYDSTTHPHHHIYCMDTGTLVDLDADQVQVTGIPSLPEGTELAGVEVVVRVRRCP